MNSKKQAIIHVHIAFPSSSAGGLERMTKKRRGYVVLRPCVGAVRVRIAESEHVFFIRMGSKTQLGPHPRSFHNFIFHVPTHDFGIH